MQERIFGDREKAMEEVYFRDQDAKLLEKLRRKANLDEIAMALGEKLNVDNPELLRKVRDLGVTLDTAPAFFLAPLVQVAWAAGKVTSPDRDAVLRHARQRGIDAASPAYAQLREWLRVRPSSALFETALEVIRFGFSVMPPAEREERIQYVVQLCRDVAEASGWLGRLVGSAGVSKAAAATLDAINRGLRTRA